MYPASVYTAALGAMITNSTPLVPDRYYIRRPGSRAIMRCHPEGTPGIDRDATVVINDLGLRGRMPTDADRLKLLVIGGSTVEDALLNDGETWCDRLGQNLGPGVWVGNMGRAGTNARHHVIQLERTLPYLPKPDAILVLCGLNDMLADLGCHGAEREPSLGQCFGAGPWIEPVPDGDFDIGAQFAAYKARRRACQNWIEGIDCAKLADDTMAYADSLSRVIAEARQFAPVVLITQPTLWTALISSQEEAEQCYGGGVGSPDGWFANPDAPWHTVDSLCRSLARYNEIMRYVAAQDDVPCIDAAAAPFGPPHYYDDFHFSMRGAEIFAACIAPLVKMRVDEMGRPA